MKPLHNITAALIIAALSLLLATSSHALSVPTASLAALRARNNARKTSLIPVFASSLRPFDTSKHWANSTHHPSAHTSDIDLQTPLRGKHNCRHPNARRYTLSHIHNLYWNVGERILNAPEICQQHGEAVYTFVALFSSEYGGGADGDAWMILDEDCRLRTVWVHSFMHPKNCPGPWHVKLPYLPFEMTNWYRGDPMQSRNNIWFSYADGVYRTMEDHGGVKGSHCRGVKSILAPGFDANRDNKHPRACGLAFPIHGEHGWQGEPDE